MRARKKKIIMKTQGREAVILYLVGKEYRELRLFNSVFDLNDFEDYLRHTLKNYKPGKMTVDELNKKGRHLYLQVFEIEEKAKLKNKVKFFLNELFDFEGQYLPNVSESLSVNEFG